MYQTGFILNVNKLAYITSYIYQFFWQYAVKLVWKMWSSSSNQLNYRGIGVLTIMGFLDRYGND